MTDGQPATNKARIGGAGEAARWFDLLDDAVLALICYEVLHDDRDGSVTRGSTAALVRLGRTCRRLHAVTERRDVWVADAPATGVALTFGAETDRWWECVPASVRDAVEKLRFTKINAVPTPEMGSAFSRFDDLSVSMDSGARGINVCTPPPAVRILRLRQPPGGHSLVVATPALTRFDHNGGDVWWLSTTGGEWHLFHEPCIAIRELTLRGPPARNQSIALSEVRAMFPLLAVLTVVGGVVVWDIVPRFEVRVLPTADRR